MIILKLFVLFGVLVGIATYLLLNFIEWFTD